MPVSKKRKKKRIKPSGPPLPKSELSAKKKKLSRQQILIYVFSALVILSLAVGFVISSVGSQPVQPGAPGSTQNTLTSTPATPAEETTEKSETAPETTSESTTEATSESGSGN